MTEHKFTKEEIMKALECCQVTKDNECEDCPYYNETDDNLDCLSKLCADALNLVNRYRTEIESARAEVMAQAEMICTLTSIKTSVIKSAKSEAIKEFAERLKDEIEIGLHYKGDIVHRVIDNIVKETTEGGDG